MYFFLVIYSPSSYQLKCRHLTKSASEIWQAANVSHSKTKQHTELEVAEYDFFFFFFQKKEKTMILAEYHKDREEEEKKTLSS